MVESVRVIRAQERSIPEGWLKAYGRREELQLLPEEWVALDWGEESDTFGKQQDTRMNTTCWPVDEGPTEAQLGEEEWGQIGPKLCLDLRY